MDFLNKAKEAVVLRFMKLSTFVLLASPGAIFMTCQPGYGFKHQDRKHFEVAASGCHRDLGITVCPNY